LSEGSSLTAREHLSVLGPAGVHVDMLSAVVQPLGRFSRWCGQVISVPAVAQDPFGYLKAVSEVISAGRYDALLPTHEQAWLFAAGRHLLPADAPLAVAPIEAFDRVQSKVSFCELLDELALPQPSWSVVTTVADVGAVGFPCWMKSTYSTAGRGVRFIDTRAVGEQAFGELAGSGEQVLVQQPAPGAYAQAAGLFSHGRLVAVHTSEQLGVGAGGSAAARIGVDHPDVRDHVARIGSHLRWHGGLTLDYLHVDGSPHYIECNPRTVEPGNAAASGVDLPQLTIAISRGDQLPTTTATGRSGQRTHSAMALMLGAAERTGRRGPTLGALTSALARRGPYRDSREVLTPLRADPLSTLPIAITALQVLARPDRVGAIAASAVRGYSVPPSAVARVRMARE
jgi:hypothetical protein